MRLSSTAALGFALLGTALADPGISPASVETSADPGAYFNVDKVVNTPEIPPKPDVVLLVDVTGSMSRTINDIKKNLDKVISTVTDSQKKAQFAVASFGDIADKPPFKVVQGLTDKVDDLHAAVDSLTSGGGGDDPEDWINALWELSNGAVAWREDGSRIIVLISDNPSHDPSGGHTLSGTIVDLKRQSIRVLAVNTNNGQLDGKGQATLVTSETGGVIISSDADTVTQAIISGLKNLDVTVQPEVVSCDAGVALEFDPSQAKVPSGGVAIFHETARLADTAAQRQSLVCSVRFLLNDAPGGDAFVQRINVTVNQLGCDLCDPRPGRNLCHATTSCAPTPYGNMCLTRPGYKADGTGDGDRKTQWRLTWPGKGHEHRVAVKPGVTADTLCDRKNTGPDVCKEVALGDCPAAKSGGSVRHEDGQVVMMEDEL